MEWVIDSIFDTFAKLEKNQQKLSIQYIFILLHYTIVITIYLNQILYI
jgi:hypothetical protein